MAILTWRDVAAPQGNPNQAAALAANLFTNAGDQLQGAVTGFDKAQNAGANQAALLNMLQYTNRSDYEKALAAGYLTSGLDPKRLSTDTLSTLAGRATALQNQEVNDVRMRGASQEIEQSGYNFNRTVADNMRGDAARPVFNEQYATAAGIPNMGYLKDLPIGQQMELANNVKNAGDATLNKARSDEVTRLTAVGSKLVNADQVRMLLSTAKDPYIYNAALANLSQQFKGIAGEGAVASPEGAGGYDPGGLGSLAMPGAAAPVAPGSIGAVNPNSPTNYNAAVQSNPMIPQFIEGLARLETAGGTKTIKGKNGEDSFNLFNIKDFTKNGTGFQAYDKVEGSNDRYRVYSSPEESKGDVIKLLATRYPEALTAKTPEEFASALKKGGYATDPDYVKKLTNTINSAAKAGPTKDAAAQLVAAATPAANSLTAAVNAPAKTAASLERALSDVKNGNVDKIIQGLEGKITTKAVQSDLDGLGQVAATYNENIESHNDVARRLTGKEGALAGEDGEVIAEVVRKFSEKHGVKPVLIGRLLETRTDKKGWFSFLNGTTTNLGGDKQIMDVKIDRAVKRFKNHGAAEKMLLSEQSKEQVKIAKESAKALEAQKQRAISLAKQAKTNPNAVGLAQEAALNVQVMQSDMAKLLAALQEATSK